MGSVLVIILLISELLQTKCLSAGTAVCRAILFLTILLSDDKDNNLF